MTDQHADSRARSRAPRERLFNFDGEGNPLCVPFYQPEPEPATASPPLALKQAAAFIGKQDPETFLGTNLSDLEESTTQDYVALVGENAMVLCDGVGGWIDSGINPKAFSQQYATSVQECIRKAWYHKQSGIQETNKWGIQVLQQALGQVNAPGSATLLFLTLHPLDTNRLSIFQVGDSGCMILRKQKHSETDNSSKGYEVILLNKSFQSHFNCPHQITKFPTDPNHSYWSIPENRMLFTSADTDMIKQVKIKNYENYLNGLTTCHIFNFNVQAKDLIISASDGLFDNLWPQQIEQVVNATYNSCKTERGAPKRMRHKEMCQAVANALCREARRVSQDPDVTGVPFKVEQERHLRESGQKEGQGAERGGKMDDISVVVSLVKQ